MRSAGCDRAWRHAHRIQARRDYEVLHYEVPRTAAASGLSPLTSSSV